jgi:hypothetical protein
VLLNTDSGGNDNCAYELHQPSGVANIKLLHGLIIGLNITMPMIGRIWQSSESYTMQQTENGEILHFNEPSSLNVETYSAKCAWLVI